MRRAWNQRIKNNEKDGNFLVLFAFFFLVTFVYFNIPQTSLSDNGARDKQSPRGYGESGDKDLFLVYGDSLSTRTSNASFTECNSVFAVTPPSFIKQEVLATQATASRDNIVSYQAQAGDTIESIAERFGISADTIKWANDIKSNNDIKEGHEILILPVSGVVYYVERGDTIGSIAQLHKSSSSEIIAFNNINEKSIIPGDRIIVPGGKLPPPPPPPSRSTTTRVATRSSNSTRVSVSGFVNPVPGGMITQSTHPYNAVDIYEPCGRPIVASANGIVTDVGRGTWPAGNFVKIDHGSVVILYAHMQSIYVTSGQQVSQGVQIGTVGNTGKTIGRTGCHLHFDVLSRSIANPFSHLPRGTRI